MAHSRGFESCTTTYAVEFAAGPEASVGQRALRCIPVAYVTFAAREMGRHTRLDGARDDLDATEFHLDNQASRSGSIHQHCRSREGLLAVSAIPLALEFRRTHSRRAADVDVEICEAQMAIQRVLSCVYLSRA